MRIGFDHQRTDLAIEGLQGKRSQTLTALPASRRIALAVCRLFRLRGTITLRELPSRHFSCEPLPPLTRLNPKPREFLGYNAVVPFGHVMCRSRPARAHAPQLTE